ncbi:MAG: cyclase family protein [Candidatus Aphodousia sp.]|nr:cyclase family protein [Sutterella sp.]MDY2899938.1 cyclase family protein [Candidatus Aphodousia sp.]
MKIIDITPLVSKTSPGFPGDVPLSIQMVTTGPARVSSFQMSAHLGAHVDAPLHLGAREDASEIDLSRMMGDCQVIAVPSQGAITREMLTSISSKRVLIKTGFVLGSLWRDDFAYLTPQATEYLIDCGVELIGIDTPSIDKVDDETLQSHILAIDASVLILENLFLSNVTPGRFQLIALPLKIAGLEASPVRAVLISDKESGCA